MRQLRIGIDSYSYHRLLGETRPGEETPALRFGTHDVLAHARELGVDGVSLETCFLDGALDVAVDGLEVVLAWGHPHGLELGASDAALADLLRWLDAAPRVGCRLVRCVAASPRFRHERDKVARSVGPLRIAAAHARRLGVQLALENHGDFRAVELRELVESVVDLAICFDTANAVRVGDDPVEAARVLAPWTRLVHLKDVEPLDAAADPITGPCSVPYGRGVVPVHEVLDLVGGDVLVCVELGQLAPGTDELELVEQSVAWLRAHASSNG